MRLVRAILSSEIAPGIVLVLSAALSMYLKNIGFNLFGPELTQEVEHWVNDGLMVIFFLYVGLEIKRELLQGNLSTTEQRALPIIGAVGGMAIPAAIFLALNPGGGDASRGWAIPSATDIAFAIGIVSLLGSRIPASIKVALTALAIIDDLGAIVIIALFYSSTLSLAMLLGALIVLGGLVALNRRQVNGLLPYALLGIVLWLFVLKSGVHATIAGVLLALTIPLNQNSNPPLIRLEHALKPWVMFLIMPIFAFVNSGIDLTGISTDILGDPITGGTMFGLFFGKQIGVFLACVIAIKIGLGKLPHGSNWGQLYGLSVVTGIGFTMSLFIGALAYTDENMILASKVGIILGSLASTVWGLVILLWCSNDKKSTSYG